MSKLTKFIFGIVLLFISLVSFSTIGQAEIKEDYSMTEAEFRAAYPSGSVQYVSSYSAFNNALANTGTNDLFIKITADIESSRPNGPAIYPRYRTLRGRTDRYRKVIIDGLKSDGSYAVFNSKSDGYTFRNDTSEKADFVIQNLTMYNTNRSGLFGHEYYTTGTRTQYKNLTFHNVNYYGGQMTRSDDADVYFSGKIHYQGMQNYLYGGTWYSTGADDGALQVANATFGNNVDFKAYSEVDGILQIDKDNATVQIGSGANVLFDVSKQQDSSINGNVSASGKEQPPVLFFGKVRLNGGRGQEGVSNAKLLLESNSSLTIRSDETRQFPAVLMYGSGNNIQIKDSASLKIEHAGNRGSEGQNIRDQEGRAFVIDGDDSGLTVSQNATFEINATKRGENWASVFKGGDRTNLKVEPKGNFRIQSDASGTRSKDTYDRALIDMGENSTFNFKDANEVDLKYTDPNYPTGLGLLRINNGTLDVDVQRVDIWNRGDDITTPEGTKVYSPMFLMKIPYLYKTAQNNSQFEAFSTVPGLAKDFKDNFNTDGDTVVTGDGRSIKPIQRLRFTFIPDVHIQLDIDENGLTDNISKPNSKTIKGTATPGSYVRISSTPVSGSSLPSEMKTEWNTVPSPVDQSASSDPRFEEMAADYTLQVDASGTFSYTLPEGHFNAGSTVKAYAFKEGKSSSTETTVKDETSPTADPKTYYAKVNSAIPNAGEFLTNVQDTNPLSQNFTYRYITPESEISTMLSQVGEYSVTVAVKDNAGNETQVESILRVVNSNEGIFADDITISQTDFKAALESSTLNDWLLSTSNAEAYEIVGSSYNDLTNKIKIDSTGGLTSDTTDGTFNVTLSVTTSANKKITKDIKVTIKGEAVKMTVKQVYTGTDNPIYTDLTNKTTVDNTRVFDAEIGEDITNVINSKITDNLFTLNYEGYDVITVDDYDIYQNDQLITPKPITVPNKDFTIVYKYSGQLRFKETTDLDFGSVPITSTNNKQTPLTDANNNSISIINTTQASSWKLLLSLPEGIKKTGSTTEDFLGTIIYKKGSSLTSIGSSGTAIETQQSNDLISHLNLKNNDSGILLQQNVGNSKGSYQGKLVWMLADSP